MTTDLILPALMDKRKEKNDGCVKRMLEETSFCGRWIESSIAPKFFSPWIVSSQWLDAKHSRDACDGAIVFRPW